MVYLLKASHSLVKIRLYVAASPTNAPLLLSFVYFSKSIIFQCVANQLNCDIVVVFEVVTFVCWFVRSDADRVNVGSKYQVSVLVILDDSRRLHLGFLESGINL